MFERISLNPHPQQLSDEAIRKINAYKDALTPRAMFVKKAVSQRDWEEFYQFSPYCRLGETPDKKVLIGFIVANQVPEGCDLMDDAELMIYDTWAKNNSISPRPFS